MCVSWLRIDPRRIALRLPADLLVPLQVFQQRFRRPPVPGGVPVQVAFPARVAQLRALAADEAALIDDRDASLRGHFLQ